MPNQNSPLKPSEDALRLLRGYGYRELYKKNKEYFDSIIADRYRTCCENSFPGDTLDFGDFHEQIAVEVRNAKPVREHRIPGEQYMSPLVLSNLKKTFHGDFAWYIMWQNDEVITRPCRFA